MVNARIMVANGELSNLQETLAILTEAGAKVVTVGDGEMARDLAMAADDSGIPFDLILMDIHRPENGADEMQEIGADEATRDLHELGFSGRIIALSAREDLDDFSAKNLGYHGVLQKPCSGEGLLELARSHLWTQCGTGEHYGGVLTLYDDGGFCYGQYVASEEHRFVAKVGTLMIMKRGGVGAPLCVEFPDGRQRHYRYDNDQWWSR